MDIFPADRPPGGGPPTKNLMKTLVSLIVFLVFSFASDLTGQGMDLNRFAWQNRIVLLFTPDLAHPEFEKQILDLDDYVEELSERQVVVITATPEGVFKGTSGQLLDEGPAEFYYQYFDVDPRRFTAVLIGLDGTEKYRSVGIRLFPREIINTIDRMPIRQSEIRMRKN